MTFDLHDSRALETYTVELDDALRIVRVSRYTGPVGFDPVVYDELEEVPQPQRDQIENRIEWYKNR